MLSVYQINEYDLNIFSMLNDSTQSNGFESISQED